MGEIVLQHKMDKAGLAYTVVSAAISNEEQGNSIYPPARKALAAHGYATVARNKAHRVTSEELHKAGIILAMTTGHARALRRICEASGVDLSKIHLWREFDGSGLGFAPHGIFGPGSILEKDHENRRSGRRATSDFYYSAGEWDVPDPWGGSSADFEETLRVVEEGSDGIIDALTRI